VVNFAARFRPVGIDGPHAAIAHCTATPGQVWAVIADGWTYSQWVAVAADNQ
jgi:hypothetical protein